MKFPKKQPIELEVTDVAFGGKGIAKPEGFTIFIDRTVPGDRVLARITRKKKSYAEARVLELLSPSPLRIDPPCPYSGLCGGCKWQFLAYDTQLEFKHRHVAESLEHIGLIRDVPVHPPIPSENIFGYRNKMEFSCSDRRWLLPEELGQPDADTGFALGLHVPGTFYKVLDISACRIQPDLGNAILETVKNEMKASREPPYGLRSHEGFWRFLMLRHSAAYDQWMINLITSAENRDAVVPLAEKLRAEFPRAVSVVNNITARKAGIAVGEYEIPLAGETVLRDRIGPFEFEISANSFFQTNTRGAERLYEIVREYAELEGGETVWDLYCGAGTISIYLSESAEEVFGIEITESAVADARRNCRINGIENCRFLSGDIKDRLSELDHRPDVMIIDPPRAGMHKDVVRQIREIGPEKMVYVSCNPATMSRDLAMIAEDYQVLEVQPVDMFPHTYHIEAVAKIRKKA